MKIKLNYYAQYKNYSCGPIALKMVFDRLGVECTREEMIELCEAMPQVGTDHESMVKAVEKYKHLAVKQKSDATVQDILCLLESGYPVIVNYTNPLGKHGHYSVINGYDQERELFIFADPANGKDFTLSYTEFEDAWHSGSGTLEKWLMVVGRENVVTTNCSVF